MFLLKLRSLYTNVKKGQHKEKPPRACAFGGPWSDLVVELHYYPFRPPAQILGANASHEPRLCSSDVSGCV